MEKTKPENPGLKGRLNPGLGFEKSQGYGFGQTRAANPSWHEMQCCRELTVRFILWTKRTRTWGQLKPGVQQV